MALDRNLQIQNAELLIEKSGNLQKTAWEFGTLDFNFTRGQQNSELVDNMYDIKQGLGAPFTISATRKYYNSEQTFLKRNAMKVTKEVKKQLRSHYYDWLYEHQLIGILDSSIVIYQKSEEFADLQYETGDSNLLSKVMISSEVQRLIIRRDFHMVNLNTIQNEIQTLLNTDNVYIPRDNELNKLPVVLPNDTTLYPIDSVPDVMIQRSYMEVMNTYYKLEKSKISPSLSAGYYNQEIDHIPGFQGWRIGLSFPLLFMPQKARSQAAYIEVSRSKNQYLYEKQKAKSNLESLLARYEQMQKSILYYENQRLNNAELIDQNAYMLYESGSIGYIEFVQNLTTSRQIREDYIKLINEYNQFVIELYYYLDY
jgi:cobalt-zinc-cadmium resistance protein CzcA